ncbi:MAG: response regulator [Gammaproteobacteria bacterium]
MENILIAEDEPHVARLLRLSLEREGYQIDVAHNGIQALEFIDKKSPDLLITDINMPKMDGEELCMNLKENFPDRSFPIAVLSSRTEVEHRQWSQGMSNTIFFEKPISIKKLMKYIHSIK